MLRHLLAISFAALLSTPLVLAQDDPFHPTITERRSITINGRATDAAGSPVAGATIFVVSTNAVDEDLGKTTTDDEGRFTFSNVSLPIVQFDRSIPEGTFQVFGLAAGFGFAWHGMRSFRPEHRSKETHVLGEDYDFFLDEPIVTNLMFGPAAKLAGCVVDDAGKPIAHAAINLGGCDYVDIAGKESHVNFREFWSLGALPEANRSTTTGEDGRFHFEGLPAECRFLMDFEQGEHAPVMLWAATTKRPASEIPSRYESSGHDEPMLTGDIRVTLSSTRRIAIDVVAADTGKPMPNVHVSGSNGGATGTASWGKTDAAGKVELRLPPGEYRLMADPPRDIPFVRTMQPLVVADKPAEQSCRVTLKPACVLILQAIDKETGQGLPDAGFTFERDEEEGTWGFVTSSTVWVDHPVTDAGGQLRVFAEPGRRRYGVGLYPEGYEPVKIPSDPVELRAGETVYLRFEFRKSDPAKKEMVALDAGEQSTVTIGGKTFIAVKRADEDKGIQLEAGRTPGTFHYSYTGRVSWSVEPQWPVDVGFRFLQDENLTASVHVDRDEPFTIEADLKPGLYYVESFIPNNWPPHRYWNAIGPQITIADDGRAKIGSQELQHDLYMEMISPTTMQVVDDTRPLLKWTPVEGAAHYSVGMIEEDFFTRKVLSNTGGQPTPKPEYKVPRDLVPGRVYELYLFATDESGKTLGHGGGYFITKK
ncbi:MAG: carboxypeptidase regulatory-like domain-containing protein [Planctomycetes bacterium]|nr:carboxypeptidase regulatory-like domain-containing protein [Planctomycetota bacterium]